MTVAAILATPILANAQGKIAVAAFDESPKPHGLGEQVREAFVKHLGAAGFTVIDNAQVDAQNVGAKMSSASPAQKLDVARGAATALGADFIVTGNVASNGSAGLIATFTFGANAGQQGEGRPFSSAGQIDAAVKEIVARISAAVKEKKVA